MKYLTALKRYENSSDPTELEILKNIKMDMIFNKTDGSCYCLPFSDFRYIYDTVIQKAPQILKMGGIAGLLNDDNLKIIQDDLGLKFLHKMKYPNNITQLTYAIFRIKNKEKYTAFLKKNKL